MDSIKLKTDFHEWLNKQSLLVLSYTINYHGVTSHYLSGPSQDLLGYLKSKAKVVAFFEQPDPVSQDLAPRVVLYENGVKVKEKTFPMWWFPLKKGRREISSSPILYGLFKVRDFVSTLYFWVYLKRRFDVTVAVESPNVIAAILIRALSFKGKVVYDMIDYSPLRFQNKWLNKIFHFLDKYSVRWSDYVWNQTDLVAKERFKRGVDPKRCAPQWVKPTGVLTHKIRQNPLNKINRQQLVYVGSFLKRDGIELLIDSFKKVAEEVPSAKLLLIGDGELKIKISEDIKRSGFKKNVEFLGVIEDESKLEEILLGSAIGLAPYSDDVDSVKLFNDVSKPKVYLSCGLPVVITQVPPVAEEIQSRGAGIAVPYETDAFAKAIVKLLKDDLFFQECRKRTFVMAKDYSWEKIFDRLFKLIYETKNK